MKFSVKFREERSPLLRAKAPFKLGPVSLSSGIAAGNKQDLTLHFATGYSGGPIVKLAFRPLDVNPLSVILKSGLGLWGSPIDAPFTVTAEISLSPTVRDRLLSVRIKPRFGDFTIRKDVKSVSLQPPQQKESSRTSVHFQLCGDSENGSIRSHPQGENVSMSSSLSNGDIKAAPLQLNGNLPDKDRVHRASMESGNAVVGSNFSLRVEGLENGHADHKPRLQGVKEEDAKADATSEDSSMVAHVPHERLHEHMRKGGYNSSASFSLAGAHEAARGWRIIAHSALPLGSRSRLSIRWGVNAQSDVFQGWDGSLPMLSFAKLPSLLLEKVSFEQIEKPAAKLERTGSSESGLLPGSFVEENRELAQVSALCYAMKRQLHLIHAENQVLRRAMEDMKSHVDSKSSVWISDGIPSGTLEGSQPAPRLSRKSSSLDVLSPSSWLGREGSNSDVHVQQGKRTVTKQEDVRPKRFPAAGNSEDVSKELEKAIFSAQNGSNVGKKD